MTTYIYGLIDPLTEELRYIGKTNNLTKRYQSHIRATGKSYRDKWVRSLRTKLAKPEMIVIEAIESNDWIEAERFWISYYRAIGALLTNLTDGGEGCDGYRHTPATLETLRQLKLGRVLTAEHREALSVSSKGKAKAYRSGKAKRCIVTTPANETVIVLSSLRDYSLDNGLTPSIMSKVARGTVKTHKGYTVKYF